MKYHTLKTIVEERNLKVGKRTSNGVFVHYPAIDRGETNLTADEIKLIKTGRKFLPREFQFDFVFTDGKSYARYMKISNLNEAHPHTVDSKVYMVKGNKISPGKNRDKIFHRLESIVSPTHRSWGFHRRVTNYETNSGFLGLGQPGGISNPKTWRKWIEEKGKNYEEYLADIDKLR